MAIITDTDWCAGTDKPITAYWRWYRGFKLRVSLQDGGWFLRLEKDHVLGHGAYGALGVHQVRFSCRRLCKTPGGAKKAAERKADEFLEVLGKV